MATKDKDNRHGDEIEELPDVSHIRNEDVKHEHTDVAIGPILKFGLFLFIAAVVIHIGIYFMYELLEDRAKRADAPPGPFAEERSTIPPEPRLHLMPGHEVHPLDEWKQMKAAEEQDLSSYRLVDQKTGLVRIPISEAKKLVLQQGLPSRAQGAPQGQAQGGQPAQSTAATSEVEQMIPTDSSSGRMLERRRQ